MKKILFILGILGLLGTMVSCELTEADIDPQVMLDGDIIFDSLSYLVSDSFPNPPDSILNTPVILAAHGFSATTFEWLDFEKFRDSTGGFLLSRVLLGGHGRTYEAFKKSSWKDWQRPIQDEYKRLTDLGFKNISIAASSTGGALVTDMLDNNFFKDKTPPKHIFMIDAIVVPGARILSLVDLVGFLVGNSVVHPDPEEAAHWYTNRPQEALNELLDVATLIRKDLEDGIYLPQGTEMTIFKTRGDPVVDPISGLLMYKGIRTAERKKISLKFLDSDRHVFTRSAGREKEWTTADRKLQMDTFTEMRDKVISDVD